jgi:hypothetical protein
VQLSPTVIDPVYHNISTDIKSTDFRFHNNTRRKNESALEQYATW